MPMPPFVPSPKSTSKPTRSGDSVHREQTVGTSGTRLSVHQERHFGTSGTDVRYFGNTNHRQQIGIQDSSQNRNSVTNLTKFLTEITNPSGFKAARHDQITQHSLEDHTFLPRKTVPDVPIMPLANKLRKQTSKKLQQKLGLHPTFCLRVRKRLTRQTKTCPVTEEFFDAVISAQSVVTKNVPLIYRWFNIALMPHPDDPENNRRAITCDTICSQDHVPVSNRAFRGRNNGTLWYPPAPPVRRVHRNRQLRDAWVKSN